MSEYQTHDIRNIALVGHAGAGKTTLAEALLGRSGSINTIGSIDKGSTTCDFEPEEIEYQHSLSPALVQIEHEGTIIHLIDTPGSPDFIGPTLSVLPAVEAVAIVINAQNGIEMMTRRLFEEAGRNRICRMLVINKIDDESQNLAALLEQIALAFGRECLPLNLPSRNRRAVVDCLSQSTGESALASVQAVHTALVDQIVEVDEHLMELYLEKGDVPAQELHDPFEEALRSDHLIPVCFTSAREGVGVQELLDVFARLMPNPKEGNPHPFLADGRELQPQPDPDRHVLARVFRVTHDPFVGKLGIFRVYQGTVSKDTQLFVSDRRKPFKVGHLLKLHGKQHREVAKAIPGDICAVAKIDDLYYDAVLHDSHDEDQVHAQPLRFPAPMVSIAIEAQSRGDEQKISESLDKLAAEDPCLTVERNASTNETVLTGLGDLHLRIALQRLKDRHRIEVKTHPPAIAYRETITRAAEGHYRHKKQSGGAGQFGEVFLRIEPLERGAGFDFVNEVVGGAIPGQFIPAVEKGVRQALQDGALAGYAMQDLRVTVYDGKFHAVDSNEISFVIAGKKAFLDAFHKAGSIVLEPIANIRITVPNSQMGDITGDLSGRRGRINDTRIEGDRITVIGQAPLAEIGDYQSRLKSLTAGEGFYTLEFSHYEAVPPNVQQQLQRQYKPKEEA